MAYTVLARKYRPQTFADLVGQEHVTRTLENAIKSQRVAHAFLFTGVRGVGKTTTARLLAKALNCEKGPTAEPCGTCDICVSITAGRDTDVLEMDGASNNSVEDVRRLQESIPYRPQRDRLKIVIVDEVHMLSTGAFNAFLKTLEEPPEHVKFIFATTESHKVPVTIRSRCQRYDFRLIPQSVVDARVREILRAEKIEADDAAVAIVAREAAGSMRDALTLLDQIIAFGGANLRGEEVAEVLGIAGRDAVHQVAEAVLEGDGAAVLRAVDQLASNGLDMLHFARQLLDLVRDMVVLQVSGRESSLVAIADAERDRAFTASSRVDLQELQRAFSGISKTVEDVAQSGAPKTTLEMGLVRLATRPPLRPLAELVARLDELERKAGGPQSGGAPGSRGGEQRGSTKAPSSAGGRAGASASTSPVPSEGSIAREPAHEKPVATPSTAQTEERSRAPEVQKTEERAVVREAGPARATPLSAPVVKPAPVTEAPVVAPSSVVTHMDTAHPVAPASGAPTVVAPRSESATTQKELSAPAGDSTPQETAADRADLWEQIVSRVMNKKPALGAVLRHGSPTLVSPQRIVLSFPKDSFFGRQVEAPDGRTGLADAAAAILGGRANIEVVYHAGGTEPAKSLLERDDARRDAMVEERKREARNHPMVLLAQDLFAWPDDSMTVHVESEG